VRRRATRRSCPQLTALDCQHQTVSSNCKFPLSSFWASHLLRSISRYLHGAKPMSNALGLSVFPNSGWRKLGLLIGRDRFEVRFFLSNRKSERGPRGRRRMAKIRTRSLRSSNRLAPKLWQQTKISSGFGALPQLRQVFSAVFLEVKTDGIGARRLRTRPAAISQKEKTNNGADPSNQRLLDGSVPGPVAARSERARGVPEVLAMRHTDVPSLRQ
jgi:hypothetical protein